MKFDVVLTNPPFQDTTRRGRTPHKLWIDFTRAIFDRLLADGGVLCQVSPSSFQSPNSPVLALMKKHRTDLIRFDTEAHFPGVGSTFADYVIYKEPSDGSPTRVVFDGRETQVVLDDDLLYIPNDRSPEGLSIHRKVIFRRRPRLPVEWDYVTCHNIRLRDNDSTLSRVPTDRHVFPVLHTNVQVWWSSIRQEFAGCMKVMWSRSGYTKPFFDSGTQGGTDMVYFVRVATAQEGMILAHNLNLPLMRYIYLTARWSGFGNERVFAALPELPRDRYLSDIEMYELFSLTEEEVAHVRRTLG